MRKGPAINPWVKKALIRGHSIHLYADGTDAESATKISF